MDSQKKEAPQSEVDKAEFENTVIKWITKRSKNCMLGKKRLLAEV